MRIAFTHNLKTSDEERQAEFDTPETVARLSSELARLGHEVHPIEVSGPVSRLVARLETLRPDLVFNTAEGERGRFREAFFPALFDRLGLAFTGSDAYACALTLDKQATKLVVQRAGVPTPRWAFFDASHPLDGRLAEFDYPVIAKPNFEGSSKGIGPQSIAHNEAELSALLDRELARWVAGVLVEEFIVGQDVTVPYLETVGVLEPAAYRFEAVDAPPGYAIYDYALKNEHSDRVFLQVPAPLDGATREALRAHTARAMRALDVRDLGRADFRVTDDGRVYFIEVNALPSLEPGASMYVSAAEAGLASEGAVLAEVLRSAIERQRITPRLGRAPESLRVGLAHNVRRLDPRGGDDAEAEFDAPETVRAIAGAISGLGHEVELVEATPEFARVVGDLDLDLVFNIAEGLKGRSREAQVPAILELLGIPYTGSDPAALALTLDKGLAKRLVRAAGIATPDWEVVAARARPKKALRFPVIVKPNAEGTSKGITPASVARNKAELEAALAAIGARYLGGALIEEFLTGREFTVGVLGDTRMETLPIMEIVFSEASGSLPIYSFADKTAESAVRFEVPARIDDELAGAIRTLALESFEALGCRDVGRVDVRLDEGGVPNFIECNPLPGLNPGFSDLCVAAEAAGLDHGALIARVMAPAVRRAKLEAAS